MLCKLKSPPTNTPTYSITGLTQTDLTDYQQLKRTVNYHLNGLTGVVGAGTGSIYSYTPIQMSCSGLSLDMMMNLWGKWKYKRYAFGAGCGAVSGLWAINQIV